MCITKNATAISGLLGCSGFAASTEHSTPTCPPPPSSIRLSLSLSLPLSFSPQVLAFIEESCFREESTVLCSYGTSGPRYDTRASTDDRLLGVNFLFLSRSRNVNLWFASFGPALLSLIWRFASRFEFAPAGRLRLELNSKLFVGVAWSRSCVRGLAWSIEDSGGCRYHTRVNRVNSRFSGAGFNGRFWGEAGRWEGRVRDWRGYARLVAEHAFEHREVGGCDRALRRATEVLGSNSESLRWQRCPVVLLQGPFSCEWCVFPPLFVLCFGSFVSSIRYYVRGTLS